MRFANPAWFYSFLLIPGLLIFFLQVMKRKRKAWQQFGNLDLLPKLISSSGLKFPLRSFLLLSVSISFIILALARPQWGTKMQTIKRKGLDIIVAIDTSKSMLAEDIKPNRLERAKYEIAHFIDKLEGDRIGLVCFAGEAFVQCPLTLDYAAAKIFLKVIDTNIIPKGGTAIGEAINKAGASFIQEERKHKVLILLTDGEDHDSDPVKAAEEASREGIKIYAIGLGKEAGEPIPLKDEKGSNLGYVKDRNGKVVMTKLDQTTLEKIALLTDGKYYHADSGKLELETVHQDIARMEKKDLQSKKYVQYEDRFIYFLWPALLCLLLELFLTDQRKVRKPWGGRFD